MRLPSSPAHVAAHVLVMSLGATLGGCRKGDGSLVQRGGAAGAPSSLPAPAPAPAPSPASSLPSPAPSSAPAVPPPSGGVTEWRSIDAVKECNAKGRDLEPNLAYGGLGIGARGKELAVAFHYSTKVKGEGLVAFAGYDSLTRTLGVPHGLGKGAFVPPVIFARKDAFLVAWFDDQGFLWTSATWAPTLPKVERLPALTPEEAGHTAVVATRDGGLLAAAPLTSGATEQVGLFLFPSMDDLSQIKAIGTTHEAKNPQHPAILELPDGYLAAWEDEAEPGRRVVAVSRFDAGGKELGRPIVLSSAGRAAASPALAWAGSSVVAAWSEGEGATGAVVVRELDAAGTPSSPALRIDLGTRPRLTPAGKKLALTFLRGPTADAPPHVALLALDGAKPSSSGLVVSELGKGKGAVAEPASVAVTSDDRMAFVFAYVDGMKGAMRTVKLEGCVE